MSVKKDNRTLADDWELSIGQFCSVDNQWNRPNRKQWRLYKCTVPSDAGWSEIYLAGWRKIYFLHELTCKLTCANGSKQLFWGKQEKEQKARDVRKSARRFYDFMQGACVISVKRRYCTLETSMWRRAQQPSSTMKSTTTPLPPQKTNDKRAEDGIFETRGLSRLPQTKQTLCSFDRLCYLSLVFQLKVKWRSARSDAWRFVIIRGGEFCCFFLLLSLLSASHISTTLNTAVQEKRGEEEAVLSLQQGQSQDWRQWSYSTKV